MINRKILYGYRIRNGILEIVPEEQQTVKRIFTLYMETLMKHWPANMWVQTTAEVVYNLTHENHISPD